MKYIVTGVQRGPIGCETRPTQESFKDYGEGEYAIRREDGSVSKHITVSINRNGNLKVEASSPEGLDGLSTIVLKRLVRAYTPIVKYLPKSASAKEYRRVLDEVQARAALISAVASRSAWDNGTEGCVILDDGTAEVTEMEASEGATKVKTKRAPKAALEVVAS